MRSVQAGLAFVIRIRGAQQDCSLKKNQTNKKQTQKRPQQGKQHTGGDVLILNRLPEVEGGMLGKGKGLKGGREGRNRLKKKTQTRLF